MQLFILKLIISSILVILPGTTSHLKPKSKTADNPDLQIRELYNELNISEIPFDAFQLAYFGYQQIKAKGLINRPDILTIIDYTKSSKARRLFVIDLTSKIVIYKELVAHGMNSGQDIAKSFSNERHSNQSSLGFFITGNPYVGARGFSLKLHGIEKNFNDKAYERGVVMHGASYVSDHFIKQNGRLGRSFGCTAVSEDKNKEIIETIKGGSCLFIYYPDKDYLSKSEFVRNVEFNSI